MPDNQDLANDIGAALRAAEQSAGSGNLGQTIADLGTLHGKLGHGFHAVNTILDAAGMAPLDWNAIAGNSSASRSGGPVANSGGTNKGEPPAEQ